jgi:hypothetical protein
VFSRAGFAPGFIAKALSTPNSDIYKPEPSELLAARVITGITDGKQFAISGLRKASKEDVALSLSTALPVFGAMQERFPTSFNSFVEQYHQDVMRGKSEAEVIENARARFIPFVHQLVSLADDDVLIDYAKLLIEQYTTLNQRDPSACYHYVSGAKTTSGSWQTILSEYQARESNIQERVIRTAVRRPTIDRRTRETLWSKVWTGVRARGVTDSDLQIIGAQTVDKSKHALYCTVNIAMFREIARLQQREAAMLMRMIFEED